MQSQYEDSERHILSLVDFFEGMKKQYFKAQKDYKRRLSKFFKDLEFRYSLEEEIKKQTDRYLASDFNVIELINPDENKVSKIISLLLKPYVKHGQDEKFLREFINEVIKHQKKYIKDEKVDFELIKNLDLSNTKVEIEHTTDNKKRIDIFIEFQASKFAIGIENKPWPMSLEREEQLEDYNSFLEKKWTDRYILIFLDGNGRNAYSIDGEKKEELKSKGRFLEVSYNNFLKPWLIRCYKECEAEKVRWFLKDFVSWIENKFRDEEVEEDGEEKSDKKLSA